MSSPVPAEAVTLGERLIGRLAAALGRGAGAGRASRRGFLGGAALLGAALSVDPWGYVTRPLTAYDTVCGADATCAAGYTVFCCTINGGQNSCPPDSFIGGWWKADNSSFCGGSARYYIDCNAYRDGRYTCHCNQTTCDQRRVACNQFRYGQCNTQISWANTGPVLCRVVSCTPPWVQFGGTCSSSSATDNNTATHSAPCLSGHSPVGVIDSVAVSGNLVHINGWVYDPDAPAAAVRVVLYEDGKPLTVYTADLPRPDVNNALHIPGNHGYSIPLSAPTGRHDFRVYAMNAAGGGGTSLLGDRSVVVNPGSPPIGRLEAAPVDGNVVTVEGWAFDRDLPSSSLRIVLYQDGSPLTVADTTIARPDVNAAFGITGTHGYQVRVAASAGTHTYRVYAMNIGGGSGNPLIGQQTVTVNPASAPAGQLDSVTVSGNTVRLTGWACDPGQPAAEIPVLVHEDAQTLRSFPTGLPRPDVNAAHAITGNHGFDITLTTGTGVHTFTVHGLNAGPGSENPAFGRRTVAVNQSATIGHVDSVVAQGSTVRLTGWAFDPQRPDDAVRLTIRRDGEILSELTTTISRPDVNQEYAVTGSHGFDVSLPAGDGQHTYTVYAAGPTQTGAPSLIGGRTVKFGAGTAAAPAVAR